MASGAGYPGGGFMRESRIRIECGLMFFMIEKDESPSTGGVKPDGNYLCLRLSVFGRFGRCRRSHRKAYGHEKHKPVKSDGYQLGSHLAPHT
jgi:hypothetical protein